MIFSLHSVTENCDVYDELLCIVDDLLMGIVNIICLASYNIYIFIL